MKTWQSSLILLYAFVNSLAFLKGLYESKNKKNAYELVRWLLPLGIIAWGDAVVLGPFWLMVSLLSLLLKDWYFFLLAISLFWVVRSFGETVYWFNQQFSSKVYEWNKPENLPLHSVFHNDSIWYIYQIIWQCVTVVSIVTSIYLANLWLQNLFLI